MMMMMMVRWKGNTSNRHLIETNDQEGLWVTGTVGEDVGHSHIFIAFTLQSYSADKFNCHCECTRVIEHR